MQPATERDGIELRRLYGTDQVVARARPLAAGALSCLLEEGAVRCLSWRGIEVIRSVAYLLRDADWGTAAAAVRHLRIEEHADRFEVRFELNLTVAEGELAAIACIEGSARGELSFSVRAGSATTLHTNRCGFVVLHPADVAGAPLTVEHTDGSHDDASFPPLISPAQPVFDIRRLRHSPCPGVVVDCLLEAELPADPEGRFEMEDQRNWSDASFKTYVGSLLDPWPYELAAGRSLRQRVRIRVDDARPSDRAVGVAPRPDVPSLRLGPAIGTRMPPVGLGVPARLPALGADTERALKWLRPDWLVAEVDLGAHEAAEGGTLVRDVGAITRLAETCAAKVQLDAICPAELAPAQAARVLARACASAGWRPDALRPCPAPYLKSYQPQGRWPDLPELDAYARAFADEFRGCQIGGGMLTFFTELNRKRPPTRGLHFIGHTTCPIVHAADDLSVVQTLEVLPHIARSVRALWPSLAYRLGPVTLAMHRNPYGAHPAANPQRFRVAMAADDPRHQAAFGAAWLAGYAAGVTPFGIDLLSFNHSHGASGPLLRSEQPGWTPGACVPAWAVHHALARAGGAAVLALEGLPAGVAGIAWAFADGAPKILLANMGDKAQALRLPCAWSAQDLSRVCLPDQPVAALRLAGGALSLEAFQVLLLEP